MVDKPRCINSPDLLCYAVNGIYWSPILIFSAVISLAVILGFFLLCRKIGGEDL